jgi:hypothetical protein
MLTLSATDILTLKGHRVSHIVTVSKTVYPLQGWPSLLYCISNKRLIVSVGSVLVGKKLNTSGFQVYQSADEKESL